MIDCVALLFATVIYGAPATPAPTPTPVPPPHPAAAGAAWSPSQIAAVQKSVDRIFEEASTLRGAQIGFLATDTMRGTTIYSREADREFQPASNFKLLVGSTVLRKLGTDFAYVTKLGADATPTDGTIRGNLYLRGGGDALLTAQDLDAAATALAAQGVKRIDGDLVVDTTHFDDQRFGYGWSWDDLPYYYAPVVTALELEDGTVHATVSPGIAGGPAVLRIWPQSGTYAIDDQVTTGAAKSNDTSDVTRVWSDPNTIRFTGSYPLDAKESSDVSPSVPDPATYAGDVLARALTAHGISLGGSLRAGKMPATAAPLWTHASEKLPKLLADFWYPSDNLMGELFLKELGVAQAGEPGTDEAGETAERTYLRSIGVDPHTVTIADGSGLSSYDRITPRDLHAILQSDWNSPYRDIVLDALPVSGVRGTLADSYKGTPAAGVVFAKSGSINHVRTISGFVQTKSHGPVTFSLLFNGWMGEDDPHGSDDLAKVRAAIFSLLATQ